MAHQAMPGNLPHLGGTSGTRLIARLRARPVLLRRTVRPCVAGFRRDGVVHGGDEGEDLVETRGVQGVEAVVRRCRDGHSDDVCPGSSPVRARPALSRPVDPQPAVAVRRQHDARFLRAPGRGSRQHVGQAARRDAVRGGRDLPVGEVVQHQNGAVLGGA